MFPILALIAFVLVTVGVPALGPVGLLPLGLALLSAGLIWPWSPIPSRA